MQSRLYTVGARQIKDLKVGSEVIKKKKKKTVIQDENIREVNIDAEKKTGIWTEPWDTSIFSMRGDGPQKVLKSIR